MTYKKERFVSFLQQEISGFLEREVDRDNGVFITVTNLLLKRSGETADVLISIFPESRSEVVFKSLKRYEAKTRLFVAERMRGKHVPKLFFKLDSEHAEERLDKLLDNVQNE
jgi:ribosome-binding factor A